MEQYIPKSVLVAEIEKLEKLYCYGKSDGMLIVKSVFDSIKNIIDTLEVKEVDLTKEIKNAQRKYKTIDEYEGYPCTMYANNIEWIAKHFFELGLKAQKL